MISKEKFNGLYKTQHLEMVLERASQEFILEQ